MTYFSTKGPFSFQDRSMCSLLHFNTLLAFNNYKLLPPNLFLCKWQQDKARAGQLLSALSGKSVKAKLLESFQERKVLVRYYASDKVRELLSFPWLSLRKRTLRHKNTHYPKAKYIFTILPATALY